MRKHGWQLPYHPLQVVAVAVFLALGFAFYVFFVPFLGSKVIEYLVMGLYTPLVSFVFCLYIWCAATDPADPGVFKSVKYLNVKNGQKQADPSESKRGSNDEAHVEANGEKTVGVGMNIDAVGNKLPNRFKSENSCCKMPLSVMSLTCYPLYLLSDRCLSHKQSSEQQTSEDGMFYCSLCEVEVLRYSKHCRVCDKCVDSFDHHCRWLNNCIGRRNYRRFFILMISALLLLILQWSVGILVLVLCFVERNRFSVEITSKLGSSFSLVPFVVVVASCTLLAMVATLPLAQLFFFHILLIKKGISTYDYIIALREQDQQGVGQQSPQMSPMSSLTGLSSASSFSALHRGAWCTPPRLFLEDQFDVVPPETAISIKSAGKRTVPEEPPRKRNAGTVRISPWALARLNADEVSKAAAEARKKSKVLQPVGRIAPRSDNGRRPNKMELPLEPLAKISASASEASASLAPLQLEARSAFRPARALTLSSIAAAASSPDSSLESPDLNPFRVLSSGAEESQWPASVSSAVGVAHKGVQLSRSTSDGYDASGGEDSDRVSSRIVHRSSNWSSLLFGSGRREDSKASCSASLRHA